MVRRNGAKKRAAVLAAILCLILLCLGTWFANILFRQQADQVFKGVQAGTPRQVVYEKLGKLGTVKTFSMGQGWCETSFTDDNSIESIFVEPVFPLQNMNLSVCFDSHGNLLAMTEVSS